MPAMAGSFSGYSKETCAKGLKFGTEENVEYDFPGWYMDPYDCQPAAVLHRL